LAIAAGEAAERPGGEAGLTYLSRERLRLNACGKALWRADARRTMLCAHVLDCGGLRVAGAGLSSRRGCSAEHRGDEDDESGSL